MKTMMAIFLLAVAPAVGQNAERELTDVDGRKIKAQVLKVTDTTVTVKRGGKTYEIKKARLSQGDLEYLDEWAKSEKHAATGVRLRPKVGRMSRDEKTYWSTWWGSYDKSFITRVALDIQVFNLRRSTSDVDVSWYFLGKHASKKGDYFAFAGGEKSFRLQPLQDKKIRTAAEKIQKDVELYRALGSKYVSGGTYYGWICIAKIDDKVVSVEASNGSIKDLLANKNKWNNIFKP